jgi:hypothetical protein
MGRKDWLKKSLIFHKEGLGVASSRKAVLFRHLAQEFPKKTKAYLFAACNFVEPA